MSWHICMYGTVLHVWQAEFMLYIRSTWLSSVYADIMTLCYAVNDTFCFIRHLPQIRKFWRLQHDYRVACHHILEQRYHYWLFRMRHLIKTCYFLLPVNDSCFTLCCNYCWSARATFDVSVIYICAFVIKIMY